MNLKNLIYVLTCLFFTMISGAALYEHIAVVPQWSAAPPASLSMFQGEYGINPESFWMMIHPVTLLFMITTLILCWKSAQRKYLLITFSGYILILISTAIYFVPELIALTTIEFSETADAELTDRAGLWEIMSIIRMIIIMGLAVVLFFGLTKSDERLKSV
ncbi:MAG: hypothetical protein JJU13_14065 [Balneolaceae bacterium]|nr:hypothetical protein [Balneolaceae bacterium]